MILINNFMDSFMKETFHVSLGFTNDSTYMTSLIDMFFSQHTTTMNCSVCSTLKLSVK